MRSPGTGAFPRIPRVPLLEPRWVCERKRRGSTGALSVGSPSFVGEVVAEGWRGLPRVGLDGPLRLGPVLVRPVEDLMPGPVRFDAKRFCRTDDLARLGGEIRNIARIQRGEPTPLSRVAPAMAAARQPLAPRLAPRRGASLPTPLNVGRGLDAGPCQTPDKDVLARGEREAGADQLLPPDPPDIPDPPAPFRAGAARAPSYYVPEPANSG